MSRQIWNEGRVVGLSAWEVYLKQHLSLHGDEIPAASEQEWLASSLAMGSSLLLKIPNSSDSAVEDTHYSIDIQLPSGTRLGTANTIVASFFDGDAAFTNADTTGGSGEAAGWATKVIDYGEVISNQSGSAPRDEVAANNTSETVPIQGDLTKFEAWNSVKKAQLRDYMKIVDGIVIQPGTWYDTGTIPYRDEIQKLGDPDQSSNDKTRPVVRLHIRGKITSNPIILLTGFSIRAVLAGVSMLGNAENKNPSVNLTYNGWKDGKFLGPAVYPWANKIVFSVPSSYITYFEGSKYKRKLPNANTHATQKVIADAAIIDMNSRGNIDRGDVSLPSAVDPHHFYSSATNTTLPGYGGASIKYNVDTFSTLGDGAAALVVYQKKSIYPAALYGSFISSSGDNYIDPLDCVAPGTMKMFITPDANILKEYETTYPGVQGIAKDERTGELYTYNSNNQTLRPIAKLTYDDIQGAGDAGRNGAVVVQAGDNIGKSLNVAYEDGSTYHAEGTRSILSATRGTIHWDQLLTAFRDNQSIDLLATAIGGSDYIDITRGDDGRYIVTNKAPLTVDGLLAILSQGDGIEIKKDGNRIIITNTKPYEQPGNEKWITLTPGTHYTPIYYGNIGTAKGGSTKAVHTLRAKSAGKHFADQKSSLDIAKAHLTVQLAFSALQTANGNPYFVKVQILTSKGDYHLGCANFNEFKFKHGSAWSSSANCRLFSITFNNKTIDSQQESHYQFNLSKLADAGQFRWYDESQPSIWNIRDDNGDNNTGVVNDVYANLAHNVPTLANKSSGTLLAYGLSISDGFNTQIKKEGNAAHLYTTPPYFSGWMNTTLKGTFFAK